MTFYVVIAAAAQDITLYDVLLIGAIAISGFIGAVLSIIGEAWKHAPGLKLWQRPTTIGRSAIGCFLASGVLLGIDQYTSLSEQNGFLRIITSLESESKRRAAQDEKAISELRLDNERKHEEIRRLQDEIREEQARSSTVQVELLELSKHISGRTGALLEQVASLRKDIRDAPPPIEDMLKRYRGDVRAVMDKLRNEIANGTDAVVAYYRAKDQMDALMARAIRERSEEWRSAELSVTERIEVSSTGLRQETRVLEAPSKEWVLTDTKTDIVRRTGRSSITATVQEANQDNGEGPRSAAFTAVVKPSLFPGGQKAAIVANAIAVFRLSEMAASDLAAAELHSAIKQLLGPDAAE